jgi:hypothetical protein
MRSSSTVFLAAAVLIVGVIAVAPWAVAQTQPTDLTGTWDMQATVELPPPEPAARPRADLEPKGVVADPCVFRGTANIVDQSGDLSGTVDLMLFSGPAGCPAEMSGMLSGGTDPGTSEIFVGGTISGPLGMLSFSGSLTPNPGGGGTFDVTQGAFMGASGSWAAQLAQNILEIPTLTAVGLTLLTLLVLGAGYVILRHGAG